MRLKLFGGYMKSVFHIFILPLLAGVVLLGAACQRTNDNVQAAREAHGTADLLSAADKNFMFRSERYNIRESVLGNLAHEKSNNVDVKDYANMLVEDHKNALARLTDLMNKCGISPPKNLPRERSEAMHRLRNLSGAEFDRTFIDIMIASHMKAVDTFQY